MRNTEIPAWVKIGDTVLTALSPEMPETYTSDVIYPSQMLASGPFVVEYHPRDSDVYLLIADRLHVIDDEYTKRHLAWIDIDRSDTRPVKGEVKPFGDDGLEFEVDYPSLKKIVIRPLRPSDTEWLWFMKTRRASVATILQHYADPDKRGFV